MPNSKTSPIRPAQFYEIWQSESPCDGFTPATEAGLAALDERLQGGENTALQIHFTDVTLRDGQQQQMNEVSIRERIEVFGDIVSTGIDRIEIGHLGNGNGDQQFAAALIEHIAGMERIVASYEDVKLQVLFNTRQDQVQEGCRILRDAFAQHYPDTPEEYMTDRIYVHVYDRVDPSLLSTASRPYTIDDSAFRIVAAANHAQAAGFKHFSISGEATTAIDVEKSIQFYRSIIRSLLEFGAQSVNINLPNTYGYSTNSEWNAATMTAFNTAVKYGFDDKVTTSIHAHNDVDNAVDFSMAALVAGFDRVEGTHIGVGERTGNTANIDVAARLLEATRHQIISAERYGGHRRSRFAEHAGRNTLKRTVALSPAIVNNLEVWYPVAEKLAEMFGSHAAYRWHRTAVGNPYAHDNGSGPHDQVMAAAIPDPMNHPGDRGYEWALLTHSMLGRPGTEAIAMGDPSAVDSITVGNFAGGGKTTAIKEGTLERASSEEITKAEAAFRMRQQQLTDVLLRGVEIVST